MCEITAEQAQQMLPVSIYNVNCEVRQKNKCLSGWKRFSRWVLWGIIDVVDFEQHMKNHFENTTGRNIPNEKPQIHYYVQKMKGEKYIITNEFLFYTNTLRQYRWKIG